MTGPGNGWWGLKCRLLEQRPEGAGSVDTGLTRARIEMLRIDLQRELEQLRHDLRQLWPTSAMSASDCICGDETVDRADQAEAEVRDRMRARCVQIVAALDRIRRGTYGRC